MEFKEKDLVYLSHYSVHDSFTGIVFQVQQLENLNMHCTIAIIKLLQKNPGFYAVPCDPIVLRLEKNNEVFISECTILNMILSGDDIIVAKIENMHPIKNQRLTERLPVSYYADIRETSQRGKCTALIKNISTNGMAIRTKLPLHVNEEISVMAHIGKMQILLTGNIIRKLHLKQDYFEYGVKITYTNSATKNMIRALIKVLKDNEQKLATEIVTHVFPLTMSR